VEVGVLEGRFSELLLANWRGKHLISVDPWLKDDPERYVPVSGSDLYERTTERLRRFGSRSSIWRLASVEAAERVPDHSLDMVYVDALHDYDSVVQDLETWYPKLRPGAIFAGHDYVPGQIADREFGVQRAVDEFFGQFGLPVYVTWRDPPWVSWLVEIPRRGGRAAIARSIESATRRALLSAAGSRRLRNGLRPIRAVAARGRSART
jgi:hypothetical protein